MTAPGGEMPFLDHLEELRQRILRALGAIVVAFGVGLWAVERLQLVALLKAPIAPYLPDGKLTGDSQTFGKATFEQKAFARIEFNLYEPELDDKRSGGDTW